MTPKEVFYDTEKSAHKTEESGHKTEESGHETQGRNLRKMTHPGQ
jgi:hypothetical protein